MEEWLWSGILSYLAYALSSSIDKHMMNQRFGELGTNTLKMFFNGAILLVFGIFFFELYVSVKLVIWSLLIGALMAGAGILYYISLKLKDASTTIPFLQSSEIILVSIFSLLLFDESLNVLNYVGLLIILAGIYGVLAKRKLKLPEADKGLWVMVAGAVLVAAWVLMVKGLLSNVNPISIAILTYFAAFLIMIFYHFLCGRDLEFLRYRRSRVLTIISASFFGAIGTFFLFSALAVGNASKVYPLLGLQSVFVFFISLIFLKEKFYLRRLAGSMLVFVGVYLLSI